MTEKWQSDLLFGPWTFFEKTVGLSLRELIKLLFYNFVLKLKALLSMLCLGRSSTLFGLGLLLLGLLCCHILLYKKILRAL